jgi:hypothetical protein
LRGDFVVLTGVNVSGLFSIQMDVVDAQGNSLAAIDAATRGARHVVHIENYSTLSKGARVIATLPHGKTRIAFHVDGRQADMWDQHVENIPGRTTSVLECRVVRTRGPARHEEPIQCDQFFDKNGEMEWRPQWDKIPFQIIVRVA